ncbi:MAG: peptidoglycan editing factor PgeF [Deltaproteobacteria bacterium]|nr:peptidoglycan editing factor PgeF [Deltaproteobacteria bacterium]
MPRKTGDAPENVRENRRRLARALGVSPEAILTPRQVHGSAVAVIKDTPLEKACADRSDQDPADALVTNVPGLCVMVLVADCVPILLYDPQSQVVAVVHAGWRGTLDRIAEKTIGVMQQHFGSRPQNVLAAMGPSIGPCCLKVGSEVAARARAVLGSIGNVARSSAHGAYTLDLWRANQEQLLEAGLMEQHVENSGVCTCCEQSRRFFSYRRDRGHTGRFGAGIFIRLQSV